MKETTAELTPMTRKVSDRITAYLTPEQAAAAETAKLMAGYISASDWVRDLIQRECERLDIVWPQTELKWGDENRITRIRNRKKNEGENT